MKKTIFSTVTVALAATMSSALFTSCGIYTKYKPAETVSDSLYGENVIVEDTVNFGNSDWKEVFTDPQLQSLIELALQNNTNYLSAQLNIEQAQASLLASKLAFLPSFALAPQASVTNQGNSDITYQLPVTASWELDIFGRMRNSKKQAQALYAQSVDYKQAVRSQLISSVANVYYTLLMLDEQLLLSQQTEEAWKETVASARALMNAGQFNEAGVSQMEATYYSVKTSVLDLKDQINQTQNSLALLLAETPRNYERGKLADQVMPEDLSVGVPLQMLANRPDVRMAERTLEAAFYTTNMARSAFYPNIVLSGSAGWTNTLGNVIVDPLEFIASAVGQLTMPLFNRGQNIANLRIAKAQQEQASLSFQQTLLNAGAEVNDALTVYQTCKEKTDLYQKQVDALEKALKSTTLLMDYGTTNYLEVLTARQSLLNAQLAQVSNRFMEIQSVISLYQALGGGR